jgi:hypothetical protein
VRTLPPARGISKGDKRFLSCGAESKRSEKLFDEEATSLFQWGTNNVSLASDRSLTKNVKNFVRGRYVA